jgi:hypothetical protein
MSLNLTFEIRRRSPTGRARVSRRDLLLQALPWLTDRAQAPARLVLIPVGFLPVTLIAATAFGVAGLRELALLLLLPSLAVVALVLVRRPAWSPVALRALAAGLVATAMYDAFRGSFIAAGAMQDPIPHIGVALGLDPDWLFGYLWRYLGNGGGMAIAFVALGLRGVRIGILYGLFVCSGLLFVLVCAPYGQQMLFPLSATTVVMAVGGHVVYGATLGWISAHVLQAGRQD